MNDVKEPRDVEMIVKTIKGLVRPFISVSIISTGIFLAVTGKIDAKLFWGTAGLIIGYYFGERAALKKPDGGGG